MHHTIKPFSQAKLGIWAEYIMYFFYALFPFITYRFLYGGTTTRSINLMIVVSVISLLFVGWVLKRGGRLVLPKSLLLVPVVVYAFGVLVSALFGYNIESSLWSTLTRTSGIIYMVYLVLLLFLLINLLQEKKNINRLILVTTISTALYSFCAFLSPEGIGVLFVGKESDAFTFGNSTFAGMYLFGAFLLSLYYVYQAQVKKWWMYVVPAVILIGPTTLNPSVWSFDFSNGLVGEAKTTSYAIVLAVLMLFVLWAISYIKDVSKRAKVAYILFGVGIVGAIIFSISLLSGGAVRDYYLSQSTGARPVVWEMSEKVIAQRPVFGWGTDNFERVFELNYDNRLLQDEYGNEAWFDRAHNVVIDQLVDNGYVGLSLYLLIYLVVIGSLIHTALHATEKNDKALASILIVYFSLHLLELQTAFDTTISYPMLVLMLALAVYVVDVVRKEKGKETELYLPPVLTYIVSGVVMLFVLWVLFFGVLPFVRSQMVNLQIRTVGTSEKRLTLYDSLLSSPIDTYGFLWRTSTDFQIGLSKNPQLLSTQQSVELLRKEVSLFEVEYEKILISNPTHFRAHLNLADMFIFQSLLGVNKLEKAHVVLDEAIKLVPESPQPYWMKSVAYLYMKKFDLAKEFAKKAYDLNPQIKQSSELINYINTSIKNFPEIELYHFKQI